MHGCCIQCVYASHTKDQILLVRKKLNLQQLICRAKEQGATYLKYQSILRHFQKLVLNFGMLLVRILSHILPAFYIGLLAHALHEKDGCQHNAYLDSDHQVKYHCQYKGSHQHNNIALRRSAAQSHKLFPAAHIISYHKQNSCNGRHGDQRCIRHQHHQDQKKGHCMYHTRYRSTPTVFDIGCRSCNGTGSRNTAKQCGCNISCALGYQLLAGAVPASNHTICYYTGKQGLNGCQDRNGESVRQKLLDRSKAHGRKSKGR